MSNLNNKELLLAAIEDYEPYTKAQRKILQILVTVSIDNIANISSKYLMKEVGITRPTTYLILKRLQEDDVITAIRQKNARQNSYQVNQTKLNYIIQLYNNKKEIKNN